MKEPSSLTLTVSGNIGQHLLSVVVRSSTLEYVNSLEWNDGMEQWSKLLECYTHKYGICRGHYLNAIKLAK